MTYTKLSQSILTSTIWVENDHTRLTWVTLLALANRHGEVGGSVPGLASIARIPVESCREAIAKFLAPDEDSRTKEDGGRRIQVIEGGWQILNYAKYRELASDEDRKRKAAERQQRMRDRRARNAPAAVGPAGPVAAAPMRAVQGAGAFAPGSLPRDHLHHVLCGPRLLVCLTAGQYAKVAPRYHGATAEETLTAVGRFVAQVEGTVGEGQSAGDLIWLLRHFDAWLVAQGRVPAAPTAGGKPALPTLEEQKAAFVAAGYKL